MGLNFNPYGALANRSMPLVKCLMWDWMHISCFTVSRGGDPAFASLARARCNLSDDPELYLRVGMASQPEEPKNRNLAFVRQKEQTF